MLRRVQIDHLLRATAAVTNHDRFVVVGTGAVIAVAAKPLPASMMLTAEIDLYPDSIAHVGDLLDLIDATIGQDSQFHRTFRYYGHGVGPETAVMPLDWRGRAQEYRPPGEQIVAVCPDPHDIAVAKLCAWRDKDRDWLRAGINAGVLSPERLNALAKSEMPPAAPDSQELARRLELLLGRGR